MTAIPYSLSIAIAVGIGLFIGFIALKETGVIVSDPNTFVTLGNMHSHAVILSFLGLCIITVLDHHNVPGAILVGILLITITSTCLGYIHFNGVMSLPPSIAPTFMKFDLHSLMNKNGCIIIFTFLLIALFDSTGTLLGVLQHGGMLNNLRRNKRIPKALFAESIAATVGALLGAPTTSPYVESASGIRAGGRTGLTALVVGIFFLLTLFFSPIALTIPNYATGPALLFVACLMIKSMMHIDWNDLTEGIPSAITMIMIPFSFSIADGIGFGFISYVLIKLFSGKIKALNPMLLIMTAAFVAYFMMHNDLRSHNLATKISNQMKHHHAQLHQHTTKA